MISLAGKVVLVSGVGPGLGESTARAVVRGGGAAVLGDLDGDAVAEIAGRVDPKGDRVAFLACDIADPVQCDKIVALTRARFGRLDATVHVAAHSDPIGGLLDGNLDEWDGVSRVNVKGTLQMAKAAVPLMRRAGGGSVVFVGSIAAIHAVEGIPQLAYGMSKAALVSATHYLARELGPDGIRVNTIAPGWKWGATLEKAIGKRAAGLGVSVDEFMAPVRAGHPLRRYTNDDEVSNTIAFFCSDLAPSITGQVLYIDGGLTA
jgi:NAD(P)-dependent dehydrogenase (short-subunit alcohol dehydrogenase family)